MKLKYLLILIPIVLCSACTVDENKPTSIQNIQPTEMSQQQNIQTIEQLQKRCYNPTTRIKHKC